MANEISNITYILSPILHKETYQLTPDVTIQIDKRYENNLRERNPQLGRVEAIGEDNPYGLTVGDVVAVNHFTFYGDIGANRSFTWQPHVELDGVKLFRTPVRNIYFRYNNGVAEQLGDFVLCRDVEEVDDLNFDPNQGTFSHSKHYSQRGFRRDTGADVLVLKSAFYCITLDGVDYFKVHKREIVATIVDGEAIPEQGWVVVEYEAESAHSFLDLSFVKGENNVTATVIRGSVTNPSQLLKWQGESGKLQVFRNQGVEWGNQRIIDEDMILFVYEAA